jgi:hypothetical protein
MFTPIAPPTSSSLPQPPQTAMSVPTIYLSLDKLVFTVRDAAHPDHHIILFSSVLPHAHSEGDWILHLKLLELNNPLTSFAMILTQEVL